VISVCHAALPHGVPERDHFGNYVMAQTVYLGRPGSTERDCAYGRSVHSIHQAALPGMAEAMADIAEALMYTREFASCAEYETYFLPACRSAAEICEMPAAWRDYRCTADRARRCLPADLLAWLDSGACTADGSNVKR
jgi:hypothetical protein